LTIVEFVHSRIIEILVAAVKLESKKYHILAGRRTTDGRRQAILPRPQISPIDTNHPQLQS
jgi:hypothetical protein